MDIVLEACLCNLLIHSLNHVLVARGAILDALLRPVMRHVQEKHEQTDLL